MPRQTATFLRRRFEEAGIHPDTHHGQNFLIDLNLQEFLVREADLGPNDVVLEVGTGTGSLTQQMAEMAGAVVTVELDRELFQLASEELIDYPNIVMLRQDALKNKNRFDAAVLEAVKQQVEAAPGRRLKLAANLPYNVATPIISNLLDTEIVPYSMTVTIQKELADRIIAPPSTKDYSALSIWIQSQCHCEILRVLPPSVFWPRPKVYSAIIQITPDEELRSRIPDRAYFHQFVRSLFFHRRKFLRSVLLAAYKGKLGKPEIDAVMEQQGFGPTSRAEELDVPTILELCQVCRAAEEAAAQ